MLHDENEKMRALVYVLGKELARRGFTADDMTDVADMLWTQLADLRAGWYMTETEDLDERFRVLQR